MDIYHTKKQTENIPPSFSYMLLKTLFYILSQCASVPNLESGLCMLDKELDNCNLHLFSQETDLLMKVIIKCVNIRFCDILGCFHYILNAPRTMNNLKVIWASTRENLSSGVCKQQRRRPACASAHSDQRLCYLLFGK